MDLIMAIYEAIWEYYLDMGLALPVTVVGVLVAAAIPLIINRNKLVFGKFACSNPGLEPNFRDFGSLAQIELSKILDVHRRHRRAAVDLNIYKHLAPQSSTDEISFQEWLRLVPNLLTAPVNFALTLLRQLLRPPTVLGRIYRAGDEVTLEASILVRGRKPYVCESVSYPISSSRYQHLLARDLALMVIRHLSPGMSIGNWRAFEKFTQALTIWPPASTVTDVTEEQYRKTEAALKAAQKLDPDSPLINYNLALLYYARYEANTNEEALLLFSKATRTRSLHLKGLAYIGLARCCCQQYHRFGQQTEFVLNKARKAASTAVELIKRARQEAGKADARHLKVDYARALYCRAFAQHVTENPEDIERGIRDYLEAIQITSPEVPDFVYNNLGYIFMVKGGRFEPGGDPAAYDEAVRYLKLALEQEPNHKMALANLGNVERLRGNYGEAFSLYREALEIDPAYANAWNELAWVHLAAGQLDQAEAAHREALRLAGSEDHRNDLKENYARILFYVDRREEALNLAREVQKANPNRITINEWLAGKANAG